MERKKTLDEKLEKYAKSIENRLIKAYSFFSIFIGLLFLVDS